MLNEEKQALYQTHIQAAHPDFAIDTVELTTHGQNNDVLVVNGAFIFRFPKVTPALEQLRAETAILTAIQGDITLDIPNPAFAHLDAPIGGAFMGYRRIPGAPLWRDTFRAIDDEETLDAIAIQLATFLKEIHSVPAEEMISIELPLADTREECADIYARMREKLFPFMRPDAQKWTERHFETFLGDPRNFDYEPALKHGDFGTSNILFDSATQRVRGIIDFGNAGLGDPAYDFAGLLSVYGESFLRRLARSDPTILSFWDRIVFYQGTFALLEALFGVENDDPQAFESGIARYV
jgi:aminoglycoside 2''-phosphotransferase